MDDTQLTKYRWRAKDNYTLPDRDTTVQTQTDTRDNDEIENDGAEFPESRQSNAEEDSQSEEEGIP